MSPFYRYLGDAPRAPWRRKLIRSTRKWLGQPEYRWRERERERQHGKAVRNPGASKSLSPGNLRLGIRNADRVCARFIRFTSKQQFVVVLFNLLITINWMKLYANKQAHKVRLPFQAIISSTISCNSNLNDEFARNKLKVNETMFRRKWFAVTN